MLDARDDTVAYLDGSAVILTGGLQVVLPEDTADFGSVIALREIDGVIWTSHVGGVRRFRDGEWREFPRSQFVVSGTPLDLGFRWIDGLSPDEVWLVEPLAGIVCWINGDKPECFGGFQYRNMDEFAITEGHFWWVGSSTFHALAFGEIENGPSADHVVFEVNIVDLHPPRRVPGQPERLVSTIREDATPRIVSSDGKIQKLDTSIDLEHGDESKFTDVWPLGNDRYDLVVTTTKRSANCFLDFSNICGSSLEYRHIDLYRVSPDSTEHIGTYSDQKEGRAQFLSFGEERVIAAQELWFAVPTE